MRTTARIALAAAVAAMVVPALAADVQSYGRAGGPVGAQRVEQLARYVSPKDLREFDAGYGRAGGPVATMRKPAPAPKTDVAAVSWFGRAGAPLPFGG